MSQLTLETVKETGYVDRDPQTRTIHWRDAEGNDADYEVGVVKLSFGEVERIQGQMDDYTAGATMISRMIRFDGQKMTYKQACDLDPELAGELLRVVGEINGATEDEEGKKD